MASKDNVPGWDRVGNLKPTLQRLQAYVIPRVATKWYGVGVQLCKDRDVPQLNTIQSQYPSNFTKACTEMFEYWLGKYPNATWNKLIKALRAPGLELNTFALEIMKDVVKAAADDDSDDDSGSPGAPTVNTTSMPAVDILSEKPDMLKLNQIVIPEVKAHWEDLAYSMGYEISQVGAIDRNGRDVGDRCSKLFEDWLETPHGCTPKTWGTLIREIKDVDELYAASKRITKEITSRSKLSAKDKTPAVNNADYHSDNEVSPFEDKSTRAVHKTKVVNKSDDHNDYEGAPAEDKSVHAAPTSHPEKSRHQPKHNNSTKHSQWNNCNSMICVTIIVAIIAAIIGPVGVFYYVNTTTNDPKASAPTTYENKVIAEKKSNDDDSSSQGLPSEDILNKKPLIGELKKIVIPKVKAHWKDLAYSMGYEIADVDAIDRDGSNVGDRCTELFKDWLESPRGCTPKTWKKLIERIKNVDKLYAAADQIQKKLLGDK